MAEERSFWMGRYEARFPTDRRYARNHMWALGRDGLWRFGFSAYAVRLLQDVYFLDWMMEVGDVLAERQEIGSIESKKAESSLYAPVAGTVTAMNESLMEDPSAINVSPYGSGWLFELESTGEGLMTVDAYLAWLDEVWKVTQRTIKGQLNE